MSVPLTRLGRYEVRSQLGAGGMGEVFLGWDADLEREVAIKVLREDGRGGDRIRRFVQEAKASSALSHPNVAHVYEIGSHDDLHFIVMERVQGETLRARMRRGAMPDDEVLDRASQIASALAAAHKAGIVHRDVKPENVMITPDGYAKVLDFGLAKLREGRGDDAATILKTTPGVAMGTLAYMAPEQWSGGEVTPATDVYALGVVLHEMVSGSRPGDGELRRDIPPKLKTVIRKSLEKDPENRYRDAGEVLEALREITRETAISAAPPAPRSRAFPLIAAIAVIAILIGAVAWMLVRSARHRRAERSIATAERLLKQRDLAGAYDQAMLASAVMPADPRVTTLLTNTSAEVSVDSTPPGATVFLQRMNGTAERTRVGVTPLKLPRVPCAEYFLTVEKPGYATVTRPLSVSAVFVGAEVFRVPIAASMKLAEQSKVPPGMVFVEGGSYRLGGFARPSDKLVELSDFFIDRYEVSNRDFEEFVRAGGYRRRELWKHPFEDAGKRLSFEQAMVRLRDATGLPGPRQWRGGVPPAGLETHPVTGVTWYEAAAYAEWKGRKLPTVYQWEKAARPPLTASVAQSFPWGLVFENSDVTERANYRGNGTMPVDSLPNGASPYGAHHMAGNVSEWCRNRNPPGYAARGGGFGDASYAFGLTAALPGMYSAPTIGFRCVVAAGDEGDFALSRGGTVPKYTPVDDATFAAIRARYDYKADPLNAKVVERVETAAWTREKITYEVRGKTVPAYLFLPKSFKRPLQVLHFAPAGDVTSGFRTLPYSMESHLAPVIRAGRAVFAVELEGFLGRPRPPGWVRPEVGTEEYTELNIARVIEMRRGLDYLKTRPDIDSSRIALLGISAGGGTGVFASALETRYRSVMFAGTGIAIREVRHAPASSRINFVSRIRAPKLLLHGRYDEDTSLDSETKPMFELLTEPKRLQVYEGLHAPPQEILIPSLTNWLDETMGPVSP